MFRKSILVFCAIFLAVPFLVTAQDENKGVEQPVGVTINGVNVGVVATLAKGETASANNSIAQLNALKVTEAKDVDGKSLDDLKDKIVFYIPTKSADKVISGDQMRGKTVKVIGKLFKQANALLVEEVTVEGGGDGNAEDDFENLPVGSKSQLQFL